MSLTRITAGVVSSNAITSEKLANGAIDGRQIADGSIEKVHFSSAANAFVTTAAISTNLTANLVQITANINAVQANVNSQRANVNTVSSNIATGDANSVAFTANVEARRTANIAGAISSVLTSDLTASRALVSGSGGKIEVSAVTSTELGHLDGVTSAVQTQINTLQTNVNTVTANVNTLDANADAIETRRTQNIAGAVSSILTADLTADRAIISTGAGKVGVSAVTATEIGHLDGVTSAIQTQLDAVEARRAANNITTTFTDDVIITGNLIINGDTTTANSVNMVVQDRMLMLANSATGAPAADVGVLFNRGNQGNAAFFYDESASTFKLSDTKDPSSNTLLSPVTASNLDVGIVTATTVKQNGANLDDLISSNVDGAISTVNDTNLTASRALASSGSGKIEVSAVTATELGYLDGVSSAIQTQLDAKQATITGAATTIDDADLTASRALVSSGSGKVAVSDVTATELGHLDGVTSAIQTQFTAAETRRTNNIAGAVSTITTSDLTASRALVSSGTGKVAVSDVTSTELGYLDGVSSAVQTQLDSKISTLDSAANDFITYTRLNANINVVSSNAAIGLKQLTNVISSTGANTFHVATPPGSTNPTAISNVQVFIDGLAQKPKTSSSDNDYIYTAGSGLVTVTDASLPSGLTVQITALYPPT